MSFGYKVGWLAVPARPAEQVAAATGLADATAVSWEEGIEQAYDGSAFLTPAVAGWRLLVSSALLDLADQPGGPEWLEDVSRALGEAQFFATHRVVEYHAWWRARNGRLVRAFAFLGESGEVRTNVGPQTPEEAALGLPYPSPERPTDDFWERELAIPTEDDVLALAGRWSIDPSGLDDVDPAETGLAGKLRAIRDS